MIKNDKVEVKGVVLNIGDKSIILSIEEIKKLKNILDDMFDKKTVVEIHKEHHHHYDHYYRSPVWYVDASQPPMTPIFYCNKLETLEFNKDTQLLTLYC